MILINLLAPGRPAKRDLIPVAQRPAAIGLVVLLCTGAGVGLWWHTLTRQAAAVEAQISRSERELVRLHEAARLVELAIARKAELSERLGLIERLRVAQRGPVSMLSSISQSLPDGLWLMELTQRGAAIQLEGRATSLTAVTDFVERLQTSGAFDHPVEIVTTSMETIDEISVVRFALKAQVVGTAASAVSAAAAAPRKGD